MGFPAIAAVLKKNVLSFVWLRQLCLLGTCSNTFLATCYSVVDLGNIPITSGDAKEGV